MTPALRPFRAALHACALAHPEIGLYLVEAPAESLLPKPGVLVIRLGISSTGANFAAPLGSEEIVVILNKANPGNSLSTQQLAALFTGAISNWEALSASSLPVQVWVLPQGDEVRGVFHQAVHAGQEITPHARLAPDPQAMLEAVEGEPGAIGYLPRAWLAGGEEERRIKRVSIEASLADILHLPVLALADDSPGEAAQTLVACLQGAEGQQAIGGVYAPWPK